jgi:hypothetical protein
MLEEYEGKYQREKLIMKGRKSEGLKKIMKREMKKE